MTDLLVQEGGQASVPAGEMPGLFPAAAEPAREIPGAVPTPSTPPPPEPEPVLAEPATPGGPPSADRRASRVPWRWAVLGTPCLGAIVVASVLLVRGGPDRRETGLAAVQNAGQPPDGREPDVPAVPGGGPRPAPKAKAPAAKKGGPRPAPKAKAPAAKKKGGPRPHDDGPDIELPPFGPIRPPESDPVFREFLAARAVHAAALKKARAELGERVPRARAQIEKSNLDAKQKAGSIKEFDDDAKRFVTPKNDRAGPIPGHPAVRDSVTEYARAVEAATRGLGEAAGKGLAAYQEKGVTDPARLNPLLAARLAGQHAELIGIWEGKLARSTRSQIWLVDVDETTGGWRIGALEEQWGFPPRDACRAEGVAFKDGALTFVAAQVDVSTARVNSGGRPTTLRFRDGALHCETRVDARSSAADLRRTDDEGQRAFFDRFVSKGARGGAGGPDVTDAEDVWRRVARLASFAYTRSGDSTPLVQEVLYMPFRSRHLTATRGPYGGLTDMLGGRTSGAAVNDDRAEALLLQHERLAAALHPYLQRITEQADAICRYRLRLGLADEKFGNTAASSIRAFQQEVFKPAIQYSFLRDADEHRLRQSLERQYPGYRISVNDAPLSAESQEKLDELLGGAGGFMENVKSRSAVSNLLAYADMAEVDRAAAFWRTWMLPLARRSGGPASATPLTSLDADWRPSGRNGDYHRLDAFALRNAAGKPLTRGVVELIAENEWGDKAAQYYYFDRLDGSDFLRLEPGLRWQRRRLEFTNTVKVTWSLWADQGSEVDRTLTLNNPRPNREAAGLRKEFLRDERENQAKGEALGAMMQGAVSLPSIPGRRHRLLGKATAPQASYAFRLPGESGRTLILRFLRFNRERNTFEAEIFDPGTRQPLDARTPVWTGALSPRSEGRILFGKDAAGADASWIFALAGDDQPEVVGVANNPGALFPAQEIPLFAVKSP